MPRGGARPGAGRPRKNPQDAVATPKKRPAAKAKGLTQADGIKAPDAPANWPFGVQPEPPQQPKAEPEVPAAPADTDDGLTDEQRGGMTPLEYMLAVMRSPKSSRTARMQAAIQAAPYVHAKPAPLGKKELKAEEAKKPSRFSTAAPPKLVAAGGKKV